MGGGGRYNGLVKECGGPDLPGVGFALGLERLLLALEGLPADVHHAPLDVFVAIMDHQYEKQGFKILKRLRRAGIRADRDYNDRSSKAQMKYANKLGARLVVMLGQDEIEKGYCTVRNMETGEQFKLDDDDELVENIKKLVL